MKEKSNRSDIEILGQHGYKQELKRGFNLWAALAIGFATISPVVGIYSVISLGMMNAGPTWVWVVPICLGFQLLVALIYAELASQYPIAGGCYQWVKRLVGPRLAWITGFLYLASALASLTTVAYLGGYWFWQLFTGTDPSANVQVLSGAFLLLIGFGINLMGIDPLRYFVNAGIIAEAVASIGIGILLLLFFRNHSFSMLFETLTAIPKDGSYFTGFLTAMAVGGWAFLGFDAVSQISEETADAQTSTPRAILRSMLMVGFTVMLTAFAVTLSYENSEAIISGEVIDPVMPSVINAVGAWIEKPFVAIVFIAFIACAVSILTYISRAIYGMSRDGMLPGSKYLRRVNRRKIPVMSMIVCTILAGLGLMLGLNATAVGTLVAFGSGGFYFVFLIVCCSALWARFKGHITIDPNSFNLGRWGKFVNLIAVIWLLFESINIAWPRLELAPEGAPWFQVWAVFVVFSSLACIGLIYMFIRKPHLKQ